MTNVTTLDIVTLVQTIRSGRPVAEPTIRLTEPVYLALRHQGKLLEERWCHDKDLGQAIAGLLGAVPTADTLELVLTRDWRTVPAQRFGTVFVNNQRGVLGLHLKSKALAISVAPTSMIASNRGFSATRDDALAGHGLTWAQFLTGGGQARTFESDQFLVVLAPEIACFSLFRGALPAPRDTFARSDLQSLIADMAGWLVANTNAEGDLVYKFWPSRDAESTADNPIRRFMATIALSRAAAALSRGDLRQAAQSNLAFNMARFYRGDGAIEWDGTVKLGAIALAGLAILESPARDRWQSELEALYAAVMHLMHEDGSFRTFLRPIDRNDNQNFYPGEALLFLATLQGERKDPALLARILRSCAYYRAWHRGQRNPAFVPWHSQAHALLFEQTGRTELRDFVFEVNDWLVPMQQWGGAVMPDLWGRFYDPRHKDYGPPHASSTGVYTEGLSAALRLAIAASDRPRQHTYERAIWRTAANLRRLQFHHPIDAFYVARREKVMGGIRTEAYDNEIRVDNVQHGLIGILNAAPLLVREGIREASEPL